MGLNYRIGHLLLHHSDLPDGRRTLNPPQKRNTLHMLTQNVYGSRKSILSGPLWAVFLHICRPNKLAVEGEATGNHCPTSTAKLPPATAPQLLEPPVARCNVKDKNPWLQ